MIDIHTNSNIELIPSERNKTWTVQKTFTVYSERFKKYITIPAGFIHDRYTFAPDLSDEVPAVVHDYLCINKKFNDGEVCYRWQANLVFYDLMKKIEGKDKRWASVYYLGVVIFSVIFKYHIDRKS